jgi:hypothetical protein
MPKPSKCLRPNHRGILLLAIIALFSFLIPLFAQEQPEYDEPPTSVQPSESANPTPSSSLGFFCLRCGFESPHAGNCPECRVPLMEVGEVIEVPDGAPDVELPPIGEADGEDPETPEIATSSPDPSL